MEFKRVNGSSWLANYRLIFCAHEPGIQQGICPLLIETLKKLELKD